ncbi:MAG: MBL fold metallo-hydrolase [Acidimicrobiia bacterium]|nr:MBL fold metallo-hydrolase [Acidimicrobiia bacterium]
MDEWTEMADGVFVRRYRSLDLNIGAILCGEGVVLVDTRGAHTQARELQSDLRRITRLPVAAVVNTHHHWDHTFGNAIFAGVPIWGHTKCAEMLQVAGESMREQVKAWAPQFADVFDEVEITPPDHVVFAHESIKVGDRRLDLRHLGRGHTDNDLVVTVPDAGVLFAGDLVEESAPPAFGDSFPLEWPDTLDELLTLCRGPVVPGHGAVAGVNFVEQQRDELAEVRRIARERHAEGHSPASAAELDGPYPADVLATAFERAWEALDG